LTALVLALGASVAWGVSDFVGPLLSRTLGTLRVLFWAQIGGCAAIGIAVAARGDGPAGWAVLFAIAASFGGMLGLFAYYRGMAVGAMSVVAPIAGVSAIVPVIFGIVTGDRPSTAQYAGIACALAGVGLASIEQHEGARRDAAGDGLALLAAIGFGFYFPWMHAAGEVDFWWASLVFRLTALGIVAAAVAVDRPALKLGRKELAIVVAVGIGVVFGVYPASRAARLAPIDALRSE
jgi:drug/metabolite transporter (DMT)-like permease